MIVTLCASAAACGGASDDDANAASVPAAPLTNPVDPATAGNIVGRISFDGPLPQPAVVRMDSDPNCVQLGVTITDETLVVGSDGALQNVFVYVKDGLGDLRFPIPSTPFVLDQEGCRYVPHVVGVQVGQSVEILNSDPTLHNVHAIPSTNQEFNTGQPLPGMRHTHQFTTAEVMVPFKCDVHPWMYAYVGVVDHPFFAVTGADGSFRLEGLPPGTYTIEAWHETLGARTQTVTIGEQETGDIAFLFPA
ncbi:MAG: carboxypeptidase regulatory-like domain-containing protein [Acidobacteria bacterium]|nr:carboxypeptidase regulatory-like domain-containing protein [Acidobacteriota bacterium]